jgi:long-chain acyl-CoA synthetase
MEQSNGNSAVDGASATGANAAEAGVASLTGPGGLWELVESRSGAAPQQVFARAPANLTALYEAAQHRADATLYVYEDERYSFGDGLALARKVAASLTALGVAPGDRVGIAMRNYPEWLWSFMGITTHGAIAVALNSWWTGEEMQYAIGDSGLRTIFVDRERLEHLALYLDEDELDVIAVRTPHSAGRGVISWEAFLDRGRPLLERSPARTASGPDRDLEITPTTAIPPDDPATILYTSGSTAHPKGVISTHRALIHAVLGRDAAADLRRAASGRAPRETTGDRAMILTVPLFHVTGLVVQFLAAFRHHSKLVGMYKWDAEKALALIERERITHFTGVPTMAAELMNSPSFGKYDTSSLRTMGGGGAAMAPEHSRQIRQRTGGSVSAATGYAMTETNGLGTAISGGEYAEHPTSCGRAIAPLVELRVTDDAGTPLPPGGIGEIWLRGAMLFSGYWNRPADTAATLVDGWLRTGDIGHLDADGFLYISGRAKDIVIRGGENVGCQEVESVIYENPKVAECAVFGVPHPRLGETVAAVVMPKPGVTLTAGDVQSHLSEHIARFKVPEHVWIRTEQLPRTASGKIFKRALQQEATALLNGRA